jgi:hypothetical protein
MCPSVTENGPTILVGLDKMPVRLPTYPTPYAGLGQYNFLAAQHSFVQGVYTVAVADEWGQLDVVHLTVE